MRSYLRSPIMKTLNLNYLSLSIGAIAALLAPATALATAGDIYETDGGSGTIFKFTPAGTKSTFASGLARPIGLAFDSSGNLFEADRDSGTIFKFTPTGVKTAFATGLNKPIGLAFDSLGNLYEADRDSGTIFKFTGGVKSTFASGLNMPEDVAVQPIFGQLLNISTRMEVLTGSSVLIAGFIITGSSNKTVLLRALGPTLSQFGLTGVLADPTLELHAGSGALITSNDNWKDTQQAAISATGKAPPDDKESAILHTFTPGNYTAIVRGKNNTTGIGLVEAYDIDEAITTTLTNISTRGFVDVGQNAMIGGFISGNGIVRVIVRALGPTLTQFGVPNVLADPMLDVRDAQGNTLASNDNWADTQQAEIQASATAPPNTKESAEIIVRPAGNTTAR